MNLNIEAVEKKENLFLQSIFIKYSVIFLVIGVLNKCSLGRKKNNFFFSRFQ